MNSSCVVDTKYVREWARKWFSKNKRRSLSGVFKQFRRSHQAYDILGDRMVLTSIMRGATDAGVSFTYHQLRHAIGYTEILKDPAPIRFTPTLLKEICRAGNMKVPKSG